MYFLRKKKNEVVQTSHAQVAFNLPEIATQVMSYLMPEHLLLCLQVCRAWKAVFELELWTNVIYLPPPPSAASPESPLRRCRHSAFFGDHSCAGILFEPTTPRVRYVNWWCKPSGSSATRLASSDVGTLICQSCNLMVAQELNYWDLHLTTSYQGGRADAGSEMRRRVIAGGGRWKVYRRMTPEQWKGRGPLIRSLAGIDISDEPLAAAVAQNCGGGLLQHLELDIPKPVSEPRKQLQALDSFFSAFAIQGHGGGSGTLTSVSIQFGHREADLRLLWSLRMLPSLRTLDIRGLVNWHKYLDTATDPDRGVDGPRTIQCRIEELLHVIIHACPDLETLRLTKLLIEERTPNTRGGHSESSNSDMDIQESMDYRRSLLFSGVQPLKDLTVYHHPNLKRLIVPMPWRPDSDGSVYHSLFMAFSHLQDLDLTVVNFDFCQPSSTDTLAKILQQSGQHLQSLTLRFQPEDVGRPGPGDSMRHTQGSIDFEVLSAFFPRSLRSLSLRDVRLHESNFTKMPLEIVQGLRRLRLNYRRLSLAQVHQAETQLDPQSCCFNRDLFEFIMFNFSSLTWLEIAETDSLGEDSHGNVAEEDIHVGVDTETDHPRHVVKAQGGHWRSQQRQSLTEVQPPMRPWACQYTLEYLDINRFPLFHSACHAEYVDHVLTERLNARVMPQLKHFRMGLELFRLPYKAMSWTMSGSDDVKGDQGRATGVEKVNQQVLSSSLALPILDFGQLDLLFVQGAARPFHGAYSLDYGRYTNMLDLSLVELEALKNRILRRGARLEYCHDGELKLF